ncbi:hypothetical protein MTR_3g060870 [Medicago truncatula]|uniref:Uncharacterized protein n=1 Tax=Medicago truncatula TaxID=3880 RepID=G7IXU0_MEDTR|nr:hypothetical protein MTR_3g060870 [Medicago truncatula]
MQNDFHNSKGRKKQKVTRSSFQGHIWGISGLILKDNNTWSIRMPLDMSRISRPPLMGRKKKTKNDKLIGTKKKWYSGDSYPL